MILKMNNYSIVSASNSYCNPNLRRRAPKNDRDPSGQLLKILNMESQYNMMFFAFSFGIFGIGWYWMVLGGTGWYWMVLDGI